VKFGSVCSGIEAASCAWHDLGWKAAWLSEIEPFPSAVLKHHYPDVPNFGDMTKFKEWDQNAAINVLVGGTPCQSFSVAGLRKGLDDPRGNLMLTYLAIANKYRPKWLVWENVPGVLSSNAGQDFASLLRGMGELGYGFAYRVLDAQYFGVAQRRRRVFVVGCLGDWRSAATVLFESHSLSGNPAPSREKGQEVAGTIAARFGISRNNHEECVTVTPDVAKCLITKTRLDSETETFVPCIALAENTIGRQPQNGGNGDGFTVGGPMYTLNATGVHGVPQPVYELHSQDSRVTELKDVCGTVSATYGMGGGNVPVTIQPIIGGVDYENNAHGPDDVTGPLLKGSPTGGGRPLPAVALANMAVRRLTPTECERLQGFPDGYTNIPWRKKDDAPDGPRYKALGNSMAVPVMHWIGKRIQKQNQQETT
jgi:DNA (cytosine-5)-methyltransferase 1